MSITQNVGVVSFEKKVVERTKAISIETPLGEAPRIRVIREYVTYHDDVAQPDKPAREFDIALAEIAALGKMSVLGDITYICDEVSKTK